jgi:hypothetical protein
LKAAATLPTKKANLTSIAKMLTVRLLPQAGRNVPVAIVLMAEAEIGVGVAAGTVEVVDGVHAIGVRAVAAVEIVGIAKISH